MPLSSSVHRPALSLHSVFSLGLIFVFAAAAIAVWRNNHDILQDLYDYSTVIVAAGKVEAGLKPYADVRSPMQSAVYVFNWATERVFGANYLGLTCGGLVQALGTGLLAAWVLGRRTGAIVAVSVAGALMLAGPAQHVVFFYNPIGIATLAFVGWGLARAPRMWALNCPSTVLVWLALIVGGANKLNFHGVALALAGGLIVKAWTAGERTGRETWANLGLLAVGGLVAPVAAELWWTGASFSQWLNDVVLLPEERVALWREVLNTGIYLKPAQQGHHHVLTGAMGGIGLVVLLATGGWALGQAVRKRLGWREAVARGGLLVIGVLGGAALMISNAETVVLTSLTYLIVAVAIWLPCRETGTRPDRVVAAALVASSLVWSVVGGYAAWHGSRVLYGHQEPVREKYETLRAAPRALGYFEGVRFDPGTLAALRPLAARLRSMDRATNGLEGMLFGSAVEWLERSYPATIVRGAPIWYHSGTSLRNEDADWFVELLRASGVRRIVTHVAWQEWPPVIAERLRREFRRESIGSQFVMYHPRRPVPPPPAKQPVFAVTANEFRSATGSNVMLGATTFDPEMRLIAGMTNKFFGRLGNSVWNWPFGTRVFGGRAAAMLDVSVRKSARVVFRVVARDGASPQLLWEHPVVLTEKRPWVTVPFNLQAAGRPLSLEVMMADEFKAAVAAGWKNIRITHAGDFNPKPSLPFGGSLKAVEAAVADLATPGPSTAGMWFARDQSALGADGRVRLPLEHWRFHPMPGQSSVVAVKVAFDTAPGQPTGPVALTLSWYRSGRYEVMTHRMLDLAKEKEISIEGHMAEPFGWVGIQARSPQTGADLSPRLRIVSWEVR